jgi:hypothetical protein
MTLQYLKVLFGIKRLDSLENEIRKEFYLLTKSTYNNPLTLESTMIIEGDARSRQHREATCLIYANLYAYTYGDDNLNLKGPRKLFGNMDKMLKEFVQPLIDAVKNKDDTLEQRSHAMKCFVECLSPINNSKKFPEILNILQDDISSIYKDKTFKLGKRLLLKEFILK